MPVFTWLPGDDHRNILNTARDKYKSQFDIIVQRSPAYVNHRYVLITFPSLVYRYDTIGVGGWAVDPSVQPSHRDTLLHMAMRKKDKELMHWLKNCDQLDVSVKNARGKTALEAAQDLGCLHLATFLEIFEGKLSLETVLERFGLPTREGAEVATELWKIGVKDADSFGNLEECDIDAYIDEKKLTLLTTPSAKLIRDVYQSARSSLSLPSEKPDRDQVSTLRLP